MYGEKTERLDGTHSHSESREHEMSVQEPKKRSLCKSLFTILSITWRKWAQVPQKSCQLTSSSPAQTDTETDRQMEKQSKQRNIYYVTLAENEAKGETPRKVDSDTTRNSYSVRYFQTRSGAEVAEIGQALSVLSVDMR